MNTSTAGPRRPRVVLVVLLVIMVGLTALTAARSLLPTEQQAAPPVGERIRIATEYGGGRLPDGATITDQHLPGIARLDPALRDAVDRATRDARDDGIAITVTSGWRSRGYQERLLDEAVSTYGSREEAARWVATPDTSAHVSGHAVDLGPTDAMSWLDIHGADFGLCRIYGNEPWHFELRPDAVTAGCPPMYTDPTEDPRMQR